MTGSLFSNQGPGSHLTVADKFEMFREWAKDPEHGRTRSGWTAWVYGITGKHVKWKTVKDWAAAAKVDLVVAEDPNAPETPMVQLFRRVKALEVAVETLQNGG